MRRDESGVRATGLATADVCVVDLGERVFVEFAVLPKACGLVTSASKVFHHRALPAGIVAIAVRKGAELVPVRPREGRLPGRNADLPAQDAVTEKQLVVRHEIEGWRTDV